MDRVVWKPRETSAKSSAPTAARAITNCGPRSQRSRPARLKRSQKAFDKASRHSSINSARSPPATTPRSTNMQRLSRRESQRLRNSCRTAGGARRHAIHTRQRKSIGGGSPSEWDIKPLLNYSTPDSLIMFQGRKRAGMESPTSTGGRTDAAVRRGLLSFALWALGAIAYRFPIL